MLLRAPILMLCFVAAVNLTSGGCRSCSSCHDYDPPVMGSDCGCGQRAGSNCGCGSCTTGHGGASACGCGSCGTYESGGYYEGQPMPMPQSVEPSVDEVGT